MEGILGKLAGAQGRKSLILQSVAHALACAKRKPCKRGAFSFWIECRRHVISVAHCVSGGLIGFLSLWSLVEAALPRPDARVQCRTYGARFCFRILKPTAHAVGY